MDSKGYRSLLVWEKAMELAVEVYRVTELLPDSEKFGLVSQMQRAAVSVPSNIAEGHSRSHTGDYLKHLSYARGSLSELETQLALAVRVNRLDRKEAVTTWDLAQEVGKMLTATIQTNTAKRTLNQQRLKPTNLPES